MFAEKIQNSCASGNILFTTRLQGSHINSVKKTECDIGENNF